MPFKSEKQRRYLWANEPEIARDWTDTYGSRIEKRFGGLSALRNFKPSKSTPTPDPVVEQDVVEEIMPAINEGIMQLGFNPRFLLAERYRQNAAFGGIMGLDGRRAYGFGSFIKSIVRAPKKIVKAVKKIAKSPLGKMALAYLATAGMSNVGAAGGWKQASWARPFSTEGWLNPTQVYGNIGQSIGNLTDKLGFDKVVKPAVQTGKSITDPTYAQKIADAAKIAAQGTADADEVAAAVNLLSGVGGSQAVNTAANTGTILGMPKSVAMGIAAPSIAAGLYSAKQPVEELEGGDMYSDRSDEVEYWNRKFAEEASGDSIWRIPRQYRVAEGGRIPAQTGGLMNLGGLEKDYRNEGGFVPIGVAEKADDVPARLSKNEFVMTADAVRGAGGGDIDRGAEVMETVMDKLQGKHGRQEMFETSERLSEVV
jgi:hypothetical protein